MALTERKAPPMTDRVHQLRILVQVAELGSFIGAARALKLPPATVSAAIRLLERDMGVRLLHRTTRQVRPTHEGEKILPAARQIAGDLDGLFASVRSTRQVVAGKLHVDVPGRMASRLIVPALPAFLAHYPGLELSVSSSDRRVDLAREGIDCVIRVGEVRDQTLVCKPLGELAMVHCASPAYLKRQGVPQHPDELNGHWVVGYQPGPDVRPGEWSYTDAAGAPQSMTVPHRVVVNNVESYLASCQAGMGLIQVPRFDVQQLLADGDLVEVLPDWPAPPMPVAALYLHRHQRSRRMAVFIDWFQGLLGRAVAGARGRGH